MAVTLVRVTILYAVVTVLLRLMGKRQIGELQPTELVVTILISEVASVPMQNNDIPLLHSLAAVIALVTFEMIGAVLSMKSSRLRTLLDGRPVVVIENGTVRAQALRSLRMTQEDLLAALRQKDVFAPADVACALFETNGQLSVQLKPEKQPATAADVAAGSRTEPAS
ncbi:MAG: DUF421 domain-containing protein [Clostridia bacterium]|nr:DUF421 domain-containing protein [Clostridia bacterium]